MSHEIGYSVGFLAKPGSSKVVIDDGAKQVEVPLTMAGNTATATLDSTMSGLEDGTLILKYYSDDNLVYQSNFLYLPNQQIQGVGGDANVVSQGGIATLKSQIGNDVFRDIHGNGAHIEIPSEAD